MKTIIIQKNDAGQRIDKYLSKSLKDFPPSLMYKYIRKKRIKLNGKRCEISSRLKEGDKLDLYINDEFFEKREKQYDFLKAPTNIDILYEDDNILLLNKKPGLIVHPDENYHFDSLVSRVIHYLYDKKEYNPETENSFTPALVNRIDRNTSGIVIAAKNAESLRILNQKMRDRELKKIYLCVVHGILSEKSGILTGYLEKNEKKNKVKISKSESDNTKYVETKYTVLKEHNHLSLVEVELLTGRTHQIRAHFASIGHPLLGDKKYGSKKHIDLNFKYQALCSYKLKFDFKTPSCILDYLNEKEFTVPDVWFKSIFGE